MNLALIGQIAGHSPMSDEALLRLIVLMHHYRIHHGGEAHCGNPELALMEMRGDRERRR